jgi:cyclophilin family peptidyl-prolyl cis-trans isomerase
MKFLPFIIFIAFFSACIAPKPPVVIQKITPTAMFNIASQEKIAPASATFDNKSIGSLVYEWDFGDGEKSTEIAPTHLYKNSGTYRVSLKAMAGNISNIGYQEIVIDPPKDCMVEINTEFGMMTAVLYNNTPLHRDNFLKLVEEGFYNDLLFHRVIPGFMAQGGDPNSRNALPKRTLGLGSMPYELPAEIADTLAHTKGSLAMARRGDDGNPNKMSSGCQFYIVQGQKIGETQLSNMEQRKRFRYTMTTRKTYLETGGTPVLDREYTVFGKVIKGLDVIDKISAVTTDQNDRPETDIKMTIRVIK